MVILMCLTDLSSDWFQGYDTNCKYLHIWYFAMLYKNTHCFVFCVITFGPIKIQTCTAPQNVSLNFSFVKDKHVVGQTWPDMVQKWLLISCYSLGVRRTCKMPQTTFEATTFDPIKIQTHKAPQNDRQNLSFVKDIHTYGKKMARNGRTKDIYKGTFVCIQTLFGSN